MIGPRTTSRPDVNGKAPTHRSSRFGQYRRLRTIRSLLRNLTRHRGRPVLAERSSRRHADWVRRSGSSSGWSSTSLARWPRDQTRVAAFASAARGCNHPGGDGRRRADRSASSSSTRSARACCVPSGLPRSCRRLPVWTRSGACSPTSAPATSPARTRPSRVPSPSSRRPGARPVCSRSPSSRPTPASRLVFRTLLTFRDHCAPSCRTTTWPSQYAPIPQPNGSTDQTVPGLIVGEPVTTQNGVFELYYLFPLTAEADTIALVQRTVLLAGTRVGALRRRDQRCW